MTRGCAIPDGELRKAMDDFLAQAVEQIEAEGKAKAEMRSCDGRRSS